MTLKLEAAIYTELDFATYNRAGFLRVKDAIGAVQQARALARTPEQMETAVHLAQGAAERRNAEQKIAEENFLKARNRAFRRLREVTSKFERCSLWGVRRLAVEQQLQHAITRFSMKAFVDVEAEAKEIVVLVDGQRPVAANPYRALGPATPVVQRVQQSSYIGPTPKSASAWYELGRTLERQVELDAARNAYERALKLAPGHFMAKAGLVRLTSKPKSTVASTDPMRKEA